MFVHSENWRENNNIDELVSTWKLEKKKELFEIYPQFYHKTDRVSCFCPTSFRIACSNS